MQFVITRLLGERAPVYSTTYSLHDVELRSPRCDSDAERGVISESHRLCGEPEPEEDHRPRISMMVTAINALEAHSLAEARFEELFDVLSQAEPSLGEYKLTEMGFARALSTGELIPRSPSRPPRPHHIGTSYRVAGDRLAPIDLAQFISEPSPPEHLKARLVRSYHWSRKAHAGQNLQLKVLFKWFAMETVLMVGKEDDIRPHVLSCLGFPTGRTQEYLNRRLAAELDGHPRYASWRRYFDSRLRAIREFRHNTVHSGFRPQEIGERQLREFSTTLYWSCPNVQGLAAAAVAKKLTSVEEFREYLPLLLEETPNLVNYVHGTVIYSLENPTLFRE